MEEREGTYRQDEKPQDEAEKRHYIVLRDYLPDFLATIALRNMRRPELHERKVIKCPLCCDALTHVDKRTSVMMYSLPARVAIQCQVYKKCGTCKGQVGIILK